MNLKLISTNLDQYPNTVVADSPSLNEHNPTFMEAKEGKWIKS